MDNKALKNILIKISIKELLLNNWDKLDIKILSKKSKRSIEEVLSICSSKHVLLDYWSQNINVAMVKDITIKELEEVSKKERVLELMLCRFDALKSRTKEVNALIKLSKKSLLESSNCFNRIKISMELILSYSGISCKGSMGLIKVKALSLIWFLTLREWSKGELIDDNALLAKLNKRLSIAEKLYKIIL